MPKSFRRRSSDPYKRLAKEAGYISRAAFKLLQIDQKFHILSRARTVLDLGAAPGGWSQLVLEKGRSDVRVVGIDIARIHKLRHPRFFSIKADITTKEWQAHPLIRQLAPFDLVLSDLAPDLTGIWERDHAIQIDLALHALRIAHELGKEQGTFVCKVFQGDLFDHFAKTARQLYFHVKFFKPKASRTEAAEQYLIAWGKT